MVSHRFLGGAGFRPSTVWPPAFGGEPKTKPPHHVRLRRHPWDGASHRVPRMRSQSNWPFAFERVYRRKRGKQVCNHTELQETPQDMFAFAGSSASHVAASKDLFKAVYVEEICRIPSSWLANTASFPYATRLTYQRGFVDS